MEKITRKTVLMLDHEPMLIDRRIVLEGQTLARNGWRVVLATRGDGSKPAFEIERGMEVHRFVDPTDEALARLKDGTSTDLPLTKAARVALDKQRVLGWIHSPHNTQLYERLRSFGMPLPLLKLFYLVAWPPELAAFLRKRLPNAKRSLGPLFECLVYALSLRPAFLAPYFRVALHRLLNRKDSAFSSIGDTGSDWRAKVKEFALSLQPGIIHAHDLPNLPFAHDLATHLNAVLIYDAHELYSRQYFSDEGLRKLCLETERRFISNADAVISVNSQCVDVLESEYGINGVVPITNAMEDPPGFDPSIQKRLWHQRFNLSEDIQLLVFQGGINPVRNIDPLIEALPSLPTNIHIGFITYSKDIPYYVEMTKRLGVFDRVHYVIEIPWNEVHDWLCSADVGIMPYQVTNFNAQISSPNKLYEFVVAGLPIIASPDLINVRRAVEDDGLGVLAPFKDSKTYSDAINSMFFAPGGPKRFKANVLAARHKYLWSNEEPKLLQVYRNVCSDTYVPRSASVNSSS